MATVPARVRHTAEQLLTAVKELSPADLREFERQFGAWKQQNHGAGTDSAPDADEALLACVQENSSLAPREQRRFNRLRRKGQAGTLTASERKELQALWRRVEDMNVARLRALAVLARRRGTDVKTLLRELGRAENLGVF
jgi:hypothetical protein